MIKIWNFC